VMSDERKLLLSTHYSSLITVLNCFYELTRETPGSYLIFVLALVVLGGGVHYGCAIWATCRGALSRTTTTP